MISTTPTLVALTISLLFLLLIVAAILLQYQSFKRYQRNIHEGLVYLTTFRQLLNLLQQHRGLSNGILCGDEALKHRLSPLQSQINVQITWLNHNNTWLSENADWEAITLHWRKLSQGFDKLNSKNCISQHTKMIANLLYLIDDSCEFHKLYELKNQAGSSMRFLWQEQLEAAEWVGQARAIGTGVAATGLCSSVEKIRLKFLHKAIDSNRIKLQLANDNKLVQLLEVIERNLLSDRPQFSAEHYFDLATAAIEQIYSSFDDQLDTLQRQLKTNKTSLQVLVH